MSIFEYDEEAVLEMLKEEYKEDGIAEGMELGMAQGEDNILNLVTKMIEAGEVDKVKLLSEDKEFLAAMRKKYLGDE